MAEAEEEVKVTRQRLIEPSEKREFDGCASRT